MNHKPEIEVVVKYTCVLGEGCIWDGENAQILWLDIEEGQIHRWHTRKHTHEIINVHQKIGALALTKKGGYLAGLENGIGQVNKINGETEILNNLEPDKPNNRFNDGKIGPDGSFWVGTMSVLEEEEPFAGSVYKFSKNHSVEKVINQVTISNGMAWDTERDRFYYIDTPTYQVVAYDFDSKEGRISNKRVVIEIPEKEGAPDGMTIDKEGMLWIAHWGGWQVGRWDPRTGKKIGKIEVPAEKVTCCTFGGEEYTDLYITTAKIGLSKEERERQPLAGALFVVKNLNYRGEPTFRF